MDEPSLWLHCLSKCASFKDLACTCLNQDANAWGQKRARHEQTREGKAYIAVPACGGSLAEAKRHGACDQNSPI
eukprot:1162106-Pelagomonas_calceolata.AAC.7